jgi:solute:Na+ symporter, SSS family
LPNIAAVDWLIILLYFFCVLAIGLSLRANVKTSKDFLQAGRVLPEWVCAVAFIAASLGSQEVIAMGATGAKYGFRSALCFSLGAIPAILFAAVFMMPLYYGSGARTVPEFLRLRFDQKTHLLNACLFLVATVLSAGVSLYLMARLLQILQVFDPLFYSFGLPRQGAFTFCILLSAAVVLAYVVFAGLAGVMVNQVLQFLLLVAGFLPMVWIGLKNIGGWTGLKASVSAASPQAWNGMAHGGAASTAALGFVLGLVLSAGYWLTDFRVLQMAMAAKNAESARRIPLFAAAARLLLPFLLILPGAIAIGLPTPHSTTMVRNENGAIYHEITVVPREAAEGRGLVPARIDSVKGDLLLDAAGHPLLNYDLATPNLLLHLLPTGLLGLGVAALLASLMSGLAASIAAASAVFTCDVYESCIRKAAGDGHSLAVGRWAAVGGVLLPVGVAYAVSGLSGAASSGAAPDVLAALLLVFSLANAPQLATFLLGMFTKRTTGHGAFAGLFAGTAAALLHHGLTLPIDASPGLHGGWIAVLHRYPGFIAQCFWTAILAFAVNLIVAAAVSFCTQAAPEAELAGLVHSLTPHPEVKVLWKRPGVMASGILLATIVLALFFV